MVAQIDTNYKKLASPLRIKRFLSYLLFEGRPLTTKGRFVNTPLKIFYKLLFRLSSTDSNYSVAYVLGTGRSGTTILGVSLSTHEDVGFLNEPKLPWFCCNEQDDVIGSYSSSPGKYILYKYDANKFISEKIKKFYKNYSRILGIRTIVDKYPEMIFRTAFLDELEFEKKYLFLYRNGIDIVNSITKWSERKATSNNNNTEDWWGLNDRKWKLLCEDVVSKDEQLGPLMENIIYYKDHQHRAAVEWIVTMKKGLELNAVYSKESFLPVRYEDYIEEITVRHSVLDFLGLGKSDSYDFYCSKALQSSSRHKSRRLILPTEIVDFFNDTQHRLGYREFAESDD